MLTFFEGTKKRKFGFRMVLELILHLKNDVTFVKDRKKSKLLISTPIWKQTPVEMLAINFRLPAANLQLVLYFF